MGEPPAIPSPEPPPPHPKKNSILIDITLYHGGPPAKSSPQHPPPPLKKKKKENHWRTAPCTGYLNSLEGHSVVPVRVEVVDFDVGMEHRSDPMVHHLFGRQFALGPDLVVSDQQPDHPKDQFLVPRGNIFRTCQHREPPRLFFYLTVHMGYK